MYKGWIGSCFCYIFVVECFIIGCVRVVVGVVMVFFDVFVFIFIVSFIVGVVV